MIPIFLVVSHKIKLPVKTKLMLFMSIEQGILVQNLKYVAQIQLELGNAKELSTLSFFAEPYLFIWCCYLKQVSYVA